MCAAYRRKAEDGCEKRRRVHHVDNCLRVFVPDEVVSSIGIGKTEAFGCVCCERSQSEFAKTIYVEDSSVNQ